MIRKLYTITRDTILGLTELPALHSLAEEAKSEAINRRANELTDKRVYEMFINGSSHAPMVIDARVEVLTKERDELIKTVASLSGDLEIERAFNSDDRIVALEKERDELKAQLATEQQLKKKLEDALRGAEDYLGNFEMENLERIGNVEFFYIRDALECLRETGCL
jgi:lysozyme family protein